MPFSMSALREQQRADAVAANFACVYRAPDSKYGGYCLYGFSADPREHPGTQPCYIRGFGTAAQADTYCRTELLRRPRRGVLRDGYVRFE